MTELAVGVDTGIATDRPRWEVKPLEKAGLRETHQVLGEFACRVYPGALEETKFAVGVDDKTRALEVLYEGVGLAVPLEKAYASSPIKSAIDKILTNKLTTEGAARVKGLLSEGQANVTIADGEIFKPDIWPVLAEENHYVVTDQKGGGVDTRGMRWTPDQIAQLKTKLAEKK